MTAWGVSQTKNLFKAGVMGAGVSDWGSLTTESDVPEFEVRSHSLARFCSSPLPA